MSQSSIQPNNIQNQEVVHHKLKPSNTTSKSHMSHALTLLKLETQHIDTLKFIFTFHKYLITSIIRNIKKYISDEREKKFCVIKNNN